MFRTSKISYGGTAAVVASTAVISGLSAAGATRPVMVAALLIAALADNLADTLSIHIFQESEQRDEKDALSGTVSNFFTRLLLCISFVPFVEFVSLPHVAGVSTVWGFLLLAVLTYFVARERKAKPLPEILKHLVVAFVVITASILIGHWIRATLG